MFQQYVQTLHNRRINITYSHRFYAHEFALTHFNCVLFQLNIALLCMAVDGALNKYVFVDVEKFDERLSLRGWLKFVVVAKAHKRDVMCLVVREQHCSEPRAPQTMHFIPLFRILINCHRPILCITLTSLISSMCASLQKCFCFVQSEIQQPK